MCERSRHNEQTSLLRLHHDRSALGQLAQLHGASGGETQHLDALAAYGVRFENFYTASPVCMPNRASFMTSRYPRVHGLRHNGCVLPASANIFVDVLAADGYKTAAIGKSHLQLFSDNPQD